ncbi:hypothetical protein [Roseomonas sp. KE2513]|nr:hypothetical protein [Roseomonas sp. KE2513]
MRPLALLLLLTVAACASEKALPKPDGHVFRLNPERWAERVNDVRAASR